MTKYKCGHETDGIILLDCNLMSMSAWFVWSDTVGYNGTKEMCFPCYCKKLEDKAKT